MSAFDQNLLAIRFRSDHCLTLFETLTTACCFLSGCCGDKKNPNPWVHCVSAKFIHRHQELVDVDEQKQKKALKEFYENEGMKKRNENRIQSLKTFSKLVNPIFCVAFVVVFWSVGLHHSLSGL